MWFFFFSFLFFSFLFSVERQDRETMERKKQQRRDSGDVSTGGRNKKTSAATLKEFVVALRPWSFTASVVAVLLGSAVAWRHSFLHDETQFSLSTFLLTLVGALSIHAAGNLTNTYFDYRSGLDRKETAGDRTLFDTNVRPKQVLLLAIAFYLVSLLVGNYFVYRAVTETTPRGGDSLRRVCELLALFFVGALLAFFYTAGPVKLKHRALGDVAIFLCFGPLLVEGTYFLQLHHFSYQSSHSDAAALWLSIPIGLVTEAILHVNNARDIDADKRANALTVARLLGPKFSFLAYVGLIWGPYLLLGVYALHLHQVTLPFDRSSSNNVVTRYLGGWTLLALPMISFPLTPPLLRHFSSSRWNGNDLCASTGQFGFLFGLLLSLAVLLSL